MDFISLKEKIEALRLGRFTCLENLEYYMSNIERENKDLNIILEINSNAKKRAEELDLKRKNKKELGRLFGLVFLVKSNISVKGMTISCASKTLENYKGSYNADVVNKLLQEDAILLGIVNNDEFASGSSGESSAFGPTKNPVAKTRVPGGSSSGSAAAVSAKFCDIALGSDTGGSIRNPASHCGIVGIKPSYGRVSRHGLIDLSMSLDQIGPLSRDIHGSALALEVIAGYSENDSISIKDEVLNYSEIELNNEKLKFAYLPKFSELVSDKRILELFSLELEKLKKEHQIFEKEIDKIDLSIQAYYPIVYTEFFSGTRKFDGIKYGNKIEESAGVEVLRRIFGGREISKSEFEGAYYKKALKVKQIIRNEFEKAFKDVDLIITPVTPRLPHKIGEEISAQDMYAYDAFTIPANLSGICAGVISKWKIKEGDEEIPVGLQIFAPFGREDLLFKGLMILDKNT